MLDSEKEGVTLGCHVWGAQTVQETLGEKEGSRAPSVSASQKEWVRLMVSGFAGLWSWIPWPRLLTSPSLFQFLPSRGDSAVSETPG